MFPVLRNVVNRLDDEVEVDRMDQCEPNYRINERLPFVGRRGNSAGIHGRKEGLVQVIKRGRADSPPLDILHDLILHGLHGLRMVKGEDGSISLRSRAPREVALLENSESVWMTRHGNTRVVSCSGHIDAKLGLLQRSVHIYLAERRHLLH